MKDQQPLSERPLNDDENSIWYGSLDTTTPSPSPELMVYFMPGNPCLISFYKLFLSHLSSLLNSGPKESRQPAIVGGSTLPGFRLSNPSVTKGTLPAGLDDQILNAEELLTRAVARFGLRKGNGDAFGGPKVILVAHSVGAYMLLEILRRKAQRLNELADVDIIGAVLLFPTVTEIAQSRQGSVMSAFLCIPYFPVIVAVFSKILTFFLSVSSVAWIICSFGGMPRHAGEATAEFIKSPMGVRQALHLARDEMKMIRLDIWDETVWGSSMAMAPKAVPLRFFFGEQDVWVSNKARDKLIASRAGHDPSNHGIEKPVMVIDNEGIPHNFIIDHSQIVAEKAQSMILDLLALRKTRSA